MNFIQPYNLRPEAPERQLLAIVAELSNIDKHRTVHFAYAGVLNAELLLVSRDRKTKRPLSIVHGLAKHDTELARLPTARVLNPGMDVALAGTPSVTFEVVGGYELGPKGLREVTDGVARSVIGPLAMTMTTL